MPVGSVLSFDDILKISEALKEYEDSNLTITIGVRSKDILDRINDDYFYRNNETGTPPEVDEVEVSVGKFHFKYVVDDGK